MDKCRIGNRTPRGVKSTSLRLVQGELPLTGNLWDSWHFFGS
jgi:hypothetical protein